MFCITMKMYNNCFTFFIISVIGSSYAQFELGEVCTTEKQEVGICKYEQTCKDAFDKMAEEQHSTPCSFEGNKLIVCCPEDYKTGLLSRFFEGTDGVIPGSSMTCHYDGYVPMMCCPTISDQQPPEDKRCPALPAIPTPTFDNPAHTVAWEKCVANERYVHVCDDPSQPRQYSCHILNTTDRISGGVSAKRWEFPHMAVLGCDSGISTENAIKWVGGGALISDKYILTAGHVLLSQFGQVRYAFLGSLDKTDIRNGELYGVVKLIPHKLYSSVEKYHDIALVLLNRRVTFSEFIRPICLPVPGIDPEDSQRLIAGWGKSGTHEDSTQFLQKANILEINSTECKASLRAYGFVWNDETMICGGSLKSRYGVTDSCQGDSGGPLMYQVKNPEFNCNYVVAGVVSWGTVCSQGAPGSYTRVSAYVDWIVATVWPDELKKASDKVD